MCFKYAGGACGATFTQWHLGLKLRAGAGGAIVLYDSLNQVSLANWC